MDTNMTAHYMAVQARRARLGVQAERGWLADQAVATQPKRIGALAVRRWLGGLMIVTGQRLQGLPRATPVPMDTAHAQ